MAFFPGVRANKMKTYFARPKDIKRDWFIIDASGIPIGRLATRVANLLRGKHKPLYTPHIDMGDAVVIINAEKIASTGRKEQLKIYHHHTGYPGGIKSISLEGLRAKNPERILEYAVKRMIPRGPLGRQIYKKLHVYAGTEHPHTAQQPKEFLIEDQKA
jgi:large subunit ribosomal protein L13